MPHMRSVLEPHWNVGGLKPAAVLRSSTHIQVQSACVSGAGVNAHLQPSRDAPAGSTDQPPPPAAAVAPLPLLPRLSADSWLRSVWTYEEHLPILYEPGLQFHHDAHPGGAGGGVRLPVDLDDSACRLVVGLNDQAWTAGAGDASGAIVVVLCDLLCDSAELWHHVGRAALPAFAIHVPPSMLSRLEEAQGAGIGVSALALRYLDCVLACVPHMASSGIDVVLLGTSSPTSLLALELAVQLRLRKCTLPRVISQAVALRVCPPGLEPPAHSSPAYQALFASVVALSAGEPPSFSTFMEFMSGHDSVDAQLESLSTLRPNSVSRMAWDADVEGAMRRVANLTALAQSRLPWRTISAHVDEAGRSMAALRPRLRRARSFARIFRAASTPASSVDGAEEGLVVV